jgi:OmcA/MtrC family decaheme c-type cytochrome
MSFIRWIPLAIVAAAMLVIAGCGSDGAQGPAGPPGQDAISTSTALETCAVCHADGTLVDIDIAGNGTHTPTAPTAEWDVTITEVVTTSNNVKVTVLIEDRVTAGVVTTAGASDIRFMFAQLNAGTAADVTATWDSHYKRYDNDVPTYHRADDPTVTPDLSQSASGLYSFTLGVGLGSGSTHRGIVDQPAGTLVDLSTLATYDPLRPQRLGVQVSNGVSNAVFDWTPQAPGVQVASGTIDAGVESGTITNQVVDTTACNQCHGAGGTNGLGFHGNTRRSVEYCVTCHNPGIAGAVPADQQFEFKQMIHKIHMGKNLPSVQAGATTVLGDAGFAKGGFPQPIQNCAKCHSSAASAAAAWNTVPTIEACGSCHDTVNFATGVGHVGGSATDSSGCAGCHVGASGTVISGSLVRVQDVHRVAQIQAAADGYGYVLQSAVFDPDTGNLTVQFYAVSDPGGTDTKLNLSTDPIFTSSGASLGLKVGWKGVGKADYTNEGVGGSDPGSPLSLSVVSGSPPTLKTSIAVSTGGTATISEAGLVYTAVIPLPAAAQAAGTGIVMIDGHPAMEVVASTLDVIDRLPIKNVVSEFAITDSSADTRRTVVANNLSACVTCHDSLSLHGNNRQGDIRVCTTCHNSANTDIAVRPAGVGVDGKEEESVDMKYMIHRIHRGRDSLAGGITIYGFGGSVNAFGGEYPRGALLNACETCHVTTATGNYKPPLAAGMEGTTIDSGSVGHADDLNISPTASVCSGCHDSNIAKGHMVLMGGSFSVLEENTIY